MRLQVTVGLYGPVGNPEKPKIVTQNTFMVDLGPTVKKCGLVSSMKPVKGNCIIVYCMQMTDDAYAAGQYIIPNTEDSVVVEMCFFAFS